MKDTTATISQKGKSPSSQTIVKAAALALLVSSATIALDAARTPAHAQDGGVTWLDTIAVVGTRTETSVQDNPASVTVVDQEEIAKKSGESIADMLRDVPGVEVVDDSIPGMKRLSIRGESSRRVTILVDGQEITDHSNYGTPILIDPSNVERIEVVRGPASVLHGAKAIGGVVNIITKKGADKPVQFETGGTYYSGTAGWQGWAAVSGTVGNFDYRFSGSLDDHGDRRVPDGRYTSTGRLEDTPFSNDYLSAHLGYTFGEAGNHYIAVKAEQHRLSTKSWIGEIDPSITHFSIDLPQRDRRKVGIYYDGKDLGPVIKNVHLDAYYQTVDRLFMNDVETYTPAAPPATPFATTTRVGSTSDDKNVNFGGTAQVDMQFHPDHYTIFGISYLSDQLSSAKDTNVYNSIARPTPPGPLNMYVHAKSLNDATIDTVSGFAQNEWSFHDDFKLTTGARYYYTSITHDKYMVGSAVSPIAPPAAPGLASGTTSPDKSDGRLVTSTGLTYTGIENTTLRALYSEGYITPSLVQMFMLTSGGGITINGNPDLEAETSRSFELGARYNTGDVIIDGTVFYTQAKNYITTTPDPAGAIGDLTYVNANRATTYGLELAAEYTIPGTALTPYVSGAWMRRMIEMEEATFSWSTYNSNTPALSGRFGVRWQGEVANHNAWADLYARVGSGAKQTTWSATDGFETDSVPGYATLNFAFGGSFGGEDDDRFRYAVNFNNILDKEYRSSLAELPGIGRSVEVSLRMKF
ncbi:TonB-dependent receptor plug domain-containing protein [Aquamicrobium sp.]|uniref:TonB-dependent receptor plug domain-containing protein n=1 Tax=Aquamicrobium sp. TaxID=1872579 RepID=UPI00349EDED8